MTWMLFVIGRMVLTDEIGMKEEKNYMKSVLQLEMLKIILKQSFYLTGCGEWNLYDERKYIQGKQIRLAEKGVSRNKVHSRKIDGID